MTLDHASHNFTVKGHPSVLLSNILGYLSFYRMSTYYGGVWWVCSLYMGLTSFWLQYSTIWCRIQEMELYKMDRMKWCKT